MNGQSTIGDLGIVKDDSLDLVVSSLQEYMQIFFRGIDGKTITLTVKPDTTITQLQVLAEKQYGCPFFFERDFSESTGGRPLVEEKT